MPAGRIKVTLPILPKIVALATSLEELENEVQILHLRTDTYHLVKKLRKSVQLILRQFFSERSLKKKLTQAKNIALPVSLPSGLKKSKDRGLVAMSMMLYAARRLPSSVTLERRRVYPPNRNIAVTISTHLITPRPLPHVTYLLLHYLRTVRGANGPSCSITTLFRFVMDFFVYNCTTWTVGYGGSCRFRGTQLASDIRLPSSRPAVTFPVLHRTSSRLAGMDAMRYSGSTTNRTDGVSRKQVK